MHFFCDQNLLKHILFQIQIFRADIVWAVIKMPELMTNHERAMNFLQMNKKTAVDVFVLLLCACAGFAQRTD